MLTPERASLQAFPSFAKESIRQRIETFVNER